ncbi:MAG TPA: type II secretion system minor pseudopilin GspK [Sphingomicrobium sp.]|nr:type II secretion system minor pseudopilin GspK [Sphingomicrobium sp.]
MTPRDREKGAALLSVLLLVAVMATIAATALDRIGVGTRLVANAATVGQARGWLAMAEQLATTRIEDLLAADRNRTTLDGGWMGVERSIALPDGAIVRARVQDGGNCFNLNSLAERRSDGRLTYRPTAVRQFTGLMVALGLHEGEAARIAASASDYVDSDNYPQNMGSEDGGEILPPNAMMADASELRAVAGVTDRHYGLLRRWVCALPTIDLSKINVNTLLPEQAPLVAMLVPGRLDLARARAAIAARPAGGFESGPQFWRLPPLAGVQPMPDATEQLQVRTSFFVLEARVASGNAEASETALIDARSTPARVVRRSWAEFG